MILVFYLIVWANFEIILCPVRTQATGGDVYQNLNATLSKMGLQYVKHIQVINH